MCTRRESFNRVMKSLEEIGFAEEEIKAILTILSGVILLGDIVSTFVLLRVSIIEISTFVGAASGAVVEGMAQGQKLTSSSPTSGRVESPYAALPTKMRRWLSPHPDRWDVKPEVLGDLMHLYIPAPH